MRDFYKFANSEGIPTTTLDDFVKYNDKMLCNSHAFIEPSIIEERHLNVTQLSVFSRLFMDRILFLGTPIDSSVANIINAQLLYLSAIKNSKINLYINSPGGEVVAGMSIYDMINYVKCPVSTTCMGMAASMGAVLLSSGTKGERRSLPHSKIMIHEPMGGIAPHTKCKDFMVEAEEMKKCQDLLNKILADNTGKDIKLIEEACKTDKWFTAQEAFNFGLIDTIITKKE